MLFPARLESWFGRPNGEVVDFNRAFPRSSDTQSFPTAGRGRRKRFMGCEEGWAILDLHHEPRVFHLGSDFIPITGLPTKISCLVDFPDLVINEQGDAILTEPDATNMVTKLNEGNDRCFGPAEKTDLKRCNKIRRGDGDTETRLVAEMVFLGCLVLGGRLLTFQQAVGNFPSSALSFLPR